MNWRRVSKVRSNWLLDRETRLKLRLHRVCYARVSADVKSLLAGFYFVDTNSHAYMGRTKAQTEH